MQSNLPRCAVLSEKTLFSDLFIQSQDFLRTVKNRSFSTVPYILAHETALEFFLHCYSTENCLKSYTYLTGRNNNANVSTYAQVNSAFWMVEWYILPVPYPVLLTD